MAPEHPKTILCMKWGTRYGPNYVNHLYRGCVRHTTPPLRFICFTDDARGIDAGVDIRPLPSFDNVPPPFDFLPWRKLSLWQGCLGPDLHGCDALVLDLDIIITGRLDPFWEYHPGKYAVIENWTKRGRGVGNTSVFRTRLGHHPDIHDMFVAQPHLIKRQYSNEQEYISSQLLQEQVFWPGAWCRSFKEELIPRWPHRFWRDVPLPGNARIIVFHGRPDPDEAIVGKWPVRQSWKKLYQSIRPVPWIAEHWR